MDGGGISGQRAMEIRARERRKAGLGSEGRWKGLGKYSPGRRDGADEVVVGGDANPLTEGVARDAPWFSAVGPTVLPFFFRRLLRVGELGVSRGVAARDIAADLSISERPCPAKT